MEKSNQKNSGWIWLHRKIRDNWIWQDPIKLKWWIDILLQVNHDEKTVKINVGMHIIDCGRGQTIMSLQNWAERWNVSKGCARHFLTLLQSDGMITLENVKKSTRITVCNFDYYNKPAHDRETIGKRSVNDAKTMRDPNNNVNNVNNVNNGNTSTKFSKKNLPPEVYSLFDEWIKQQKNDLKHLFNPSKYKKEYDYLQTIPAAEAIEVIKKAIAGACHTLEPLTDSEKASIGNPDWHWDIEYLKSNAEREEDEVYKIHEEWNQTHENGVSRPD